MLKKTLYSLFVSITSLGFSVASYPTTFDIQSYFHTMYAHTEVIGQSNQYTSAIIPHDYFIETINAATALNKEFLSRACSGVMPGGIKVNEWIPENPPFIAKVMLPVGTRIIFFGDLHGSIHAFIRCLEKLMVDGFIDEHLRILDPGVRIIFLGDLVDYGIYGIDTLFTVLQIQLRNPDKVFICRGNHESIGSMQNSFFQEYRTRFGRQVFQCPYFINKVQELKSMYDFSHLEYRWRVPFSFLMADLCSLFPLALFIGIDGKPEEGYVQCCHGGIEEGAQESIRFLLTGDQTIAFLDVDKCFQDQNCNFNLGDISGKIQLTREERYIRGSSVGVSSDHCKCHTVEEVQEFAEGFNIKMLIRGHQDRYNSFKITLPDVGDPIYPFIKSRSLEGFYSNDDRLMLNRDYIQSCIKRIFESTEYLYNQGFIPYDFKNIFDVFPVITFSNAYAPKMLDDEGFGLLTIAQSWDFSRVRAYVQEGNVAHSRYFMPEFNQLVLCLEKGQDFLDQSYSQSSLGLMIRKICDISLGSEIFGGMTILEYAIFHNNQTLFNHVVDLVKAFPASKEFILQKLRDSGSHTLFEGFVLYDYAHYHYSFDVLRLFEPTENVEC